MNGAPHTHKLKFIENTGGWTAIRVQYGDQPTHLVYTRFPGWRSRVRRVAKRMVRHHDRHSLKARSRADVAATLTQEMALWERSGAWGREVLTGKSAPMDAVEATLKREDNGCWSISGPTPLPRYFSYKLAALDHAAECGYKLFTVPEPKKADSWTTSQILSSTLPPASWLSDSASQSLTPPPASALGTPTPPSVTSTAPG